MKGTTLCTLVFFSYINLCAQSCLFAGGDFDMTNRQNSYLPNLWNFTGLDVPLVESASYSHNKGWRYVDAKQKRVAR